MRIGIVLNPFEEKKPGGLGWYVLELTRAILEIDRKNQYLIFTKRKPKKNPDFAGNNWKIIPLGFWKLWRELGFLFAPKADVYLFTTPALPLFFKLKKTIVVAHDFPYQYFKADNLKQRIINFFLHYLHKYSLKKTDKIVAISNYTKEEVKKLFKADESKISVIYNGFRRVCENEPSMINIPKPYFLSGGSIKLRKNTLGTVQAFNEFKKKYGYPHKLVIFGAVGNIYSKKVEEFIKKEGLEKEIVFFGYANANQLSYLYKNAEALVFPSLIESFGFLVLEAASCGTPVITSKYGGVSEVMKNSAALVDPENIHEISGAMKLIASDKNFRQELTRKGLERADEFSWRKTAEKFLELFKSFN